MTSTPRAQQVVHTIRAMHPGGTTAVLVDTKEALGAQLPRMLAFIAVAMSTLLFLFTRSILIPLKALTLALLSLGATLGVLVLVFQQGHGVALLGGFTVDHRLEMTAPVLVLCIAFALSVDYEVFLLSRILEEHRQGRDTEQAVARGLQHTGGMLTAAVGVMTVMLGVLATSQVGGLKMFAVGVALALIVDATLIRGILVPAIMKAAGKANWWTPTRLSSTSDLIPGDPIGPVSATASHSPLLHRSQEP